MWDYRYQAIHEQTRICVTSVYTYTGCAAPFEVSFKASDSADSYTSGMVGKTGFMVVDLVV